MNAQIFYRLLKKIIAYRNSTNQIFLNYMIKPLGIGYFKL